MKRTVGLRQKPPALRKFGLPDSEGGGRDNLDRRPAAANRPSKLQPVHRTWHLDIGEDHGDVAASFQNFDGFIGIGSLDHLKSGGGHHLDRIDSEQELVLDDQHNGSSGLNKTHPHYSLRTHNKRMMLLTFPLSPGLPLWPAPI